MNNAQFRTWLDEHGACAPALEWLGEMDMRTAWHSCKRGDWLLWWLKQAGYARNNLSLITSQIIQRTPLPDGSTVWGLLTDERSSRNAGNGDERHDRGAAWDDATLAATLAAAWDAQCDIIREIVPWMDVEHLMQGVVL